MLLQDDIYDIALSIAVRSDASGAGLPRSESSWQVIGSAPGPTAQPTRPQANQHWLPIHWYRIPIRSAWPA